MASSKLISTPRAGTLVAFGSKGGCVIEARIILLVAFFVALAGPVGADDVLINGDFETGPPGPFVASPWVGWRSVGYAAPNYEVTANPPYVYSGARSQLWFTNGAAFEGGIAQTVTGLTPGQLIEASIIFADPERFGPTRFRIGIEPNGGPPVSPAVVWSAWKTVTTAWQQAVIETTVNSPSANVVVCSASDTGGGGGYLHPYPWTRVIVDDAQLIPKSLKIANVPDFSQPPATDPMATGDLTNYCGPIAAANIIEYWDVVKGNASALGVNAGLAKEAAPYIAYWMDTNDDGCPFRLNGYGVQPFVSAPGTYSGDIAPGLAEFARWDANNPYGCNEPALPNGKNGYSWTVQTFYNGVNNPNGMNLQGLWNQLVGELAAGRPMLVTWSYWALDSTHHATVNGVDFYEWGAPTGSSPDPEHPEEWNEATSSTQGVAQIGHIVTAVGYYTNYDPDGPPPLGQQNLPQTNWVVVHDTWGNTPVDVAVPWQRDANFTPWSANTLVKLQVPNVAALSENAGNKCPGDHWAPPVGWNVMFQMKLTETSGKEAAQLNSVKLNAFGTGDDGADVTSVDMYEDTDSDGPLDQPGDAFVASSNGPYPGDNGTMYIIVPGPSYQIPVNSTRNILIVYNMAGTASQNETFKFGIPTVYATGALSYLPVPMNVGLFLTGAKKITNFWVQPCPPIGRLKTYPDGSGVRYIDCSPVTSVEAGVFEKKIYIQDQPPEGASGIQVYFGNDDVPSVPLGAELELEAYLDTIDGERVLVQPRVLGWTLGGSPRPLAMRSNSVGGGDFYYDPETGSGQLGVSLALGLNNVGLLVKTWGRVYDRDPDSPARWIVISDGSTAVKVIAPLGVALPAPPAHVCAAGICGLECDGPIARPVIYLRGALDLRTD